MEAEETGGEVAAAKEVADGGEDVGAERAEGGAVEFFVAGEEGFPGGGEDLPEWGGPGAAGLVDGWHKECIRTISVRGKIGGDGSVSGKVMVGEL
jgi:hypothetical protein